MAINVPDHSRRRLAPDADAVPNPRGAFGNLIRRPAGAPTIPGNLYGDTKGQLAMANAIENVGRVVMDLSVREQRMREAEEEALLKDMTARYDVAENEVRVQINQERTGKTMTADEISRRYEEEMAIKREAITGNVEFKTTVGKNVGRMFDLRQRQYTARYKAGTVESIRMDNIRASMISQAASITKMATTLDPVDFEKSKENIADLTSSPQYIAAFGADRAVADMQKLMNDASINFYRSKIDADPQQTALELEQGPIEGMTEQTRTALIRTAEGEVRKIESERKEAQQKLFERQDGQLFDLWRDGKLTPDEVQRRFENGTIKESQRQKWLRQYDGDIVREEKKVSHFGEVEALAAEGLYSTDKKQVDGWWKSVSSIDGMTGPGGRLTESGFSKIVDTVNRLPTQVVKSLKADLASQNPEQMAFASRLIVKMTDENPTLADGFKKDDLQIAELIFAGRDPLDASNQILESQKLTRQQRTDISTVYKQIVKDQKLTNASTIASELEDTFGIDLDAEDLIKQAPGIVTNYNTLLESHFESTRDIEVAKSLAIKDIKQKWAVTHVGSKGPRLMAYAPEAVAGQSGEQKWMQWQFETEMTGQGKDPENLWLESDRTTYSRVPRSWVVVTENEFGERMQATDANGNPMRWAPDASMIDDQLETERQAAIDGERARLTESVERAKARTSRNRVAKEAGVRRAERNLQEFEDALRQQTPDGIREANAARRLELTREQTRRAKTSDIFDDLNIAP